MRVDDEVHDQVVRERKHQVVGPAWSPAQIVAIAIGVLYVVLGAVTLTRTGLAPAGMTQTHVSVLGFHHTPILGIGELVYGLLMLGAGAVPGGQRGMMVVLGVLALGAGLIVLIEPVTLHPTLGVHPANGWLYVVTGSAALIAAMVAPVIFGGWSSVAEHEEVAHREEVDSGHRW